MVVKGLRASYDSAPDLRLATVTLGPTPAASKLIIIDHIFLAQRIFDYMPMHGQ